MLSDEERLPLVKALHFPDRPSLHRQVEKELIVKLVNSHCVPMSQDGYVNVMVRYI